MVYTDALWDVLDRPNRLRMFPYDRLWIFLIVPIVWIEFETIQTITIVPIVRIVSVISVMFPYDRLDRLNIFETIGTIQTIIWKPGFSDITDSILRLGFGLATEKAI